MYKSMILELVFDGNCYGDNIKLFDNKEYSKCDKAFWELCERLLKDLPEDEKKKMDQNLFLALGGIESVVEEVFFKEGFKLGLKIGAQNFLD